MSRKKKKKQKQIQQKLLEQGTLNGWSCSAQELADSASAEDDYEEELEEQAEFESMPEPELVFAELESVFAEPQPVYAVPEPVFVEPEPEFAEPEPVFVEPEPEFAEPEPVFAESEPVYVEPLPPAAESLVPTPPTSPNAVITHLAAAADKVTAFLNAPRKSSEELAEDQQKFGGLDDEPVPGTLTTRERLEGYLARLNAGKNRMLAHTRRKAEYVVYESREQKGSLLTRVAAYLRELYDWAFHECYYIGVLLIRNCSDLRRKSFQAWVWIKYTVPPFFATKRLQLGRAMDKFTDSCLEPFRDITGKTRSMRYRLSNRDSQDEGQKGGAPAILARYLYSLGRPINRIVNFILPILGCSILAAIMLYFQQVNYALEVKYAGIDMGQVERESDFYEAQNQMYDRLLGEEYVPGDQTSRPTFRLVIADPERIVDVGTLTNQMLALSKNDVVTADGIYIDSAFLGAVDSGSEFLLYIDGILNNYRTDTDNERVQFVKKVSIQRGVYPKSSIRPIHEIQNAVESNEAVPQTYIVQKDETLGTIAEDNNTTVAAVLKLNPTLQARAEESDVTVPEITEGEEILVNTVELSLGIQVTRRETYTEDIDYGNDYIDVNDMMDSYQLVVSKGVKGVRTIVADVTYIDGEQTNESRISSEITSDPVNAKIKRGTQKPSQFVVGGGGNSGSFMWPVAGGHLSAGLYYYYGHTGMDIVAPAGTGIYASQAGTVTYASNQSIWPYGKRVDIQHANGMFTRYAHCSAVTVQYGQVVEQGELIAKVGRTGNASGNHCHFEIRKNGAIMNPEDYIGRSFPGYG